MRLVTSISALACWAFFGAWALFATHATMAAEGQYAAYFREADDADEPPRPEETADEPLGQPVESDDEPGIPAAPEEPSEMPDDETPGDEPLRRLPATERPGKAAPPTPVMEDEVPGETTPPAEYPPAESTPPYDSTAPSPVYGYGLYGMPPWPKGWGYNGGCCAGVWSGYCDEQPDCHHRCLGQGKLLCWLLGSQGRSCACKQCSHKQRSAAECGGNQVACQPCAAWRKSSRQRSNHGCCRHGSRSCCGSMGVDHEPAAEPPAPPQPLPYDSGARPAGKHPAVVLKHWDMPRMTSHGKTVRR